MSKKKAVNLILFALALAVFFFLSAVVVSRFILKSETVSVPDLAGLTLVEAGTALQKKDLALIQSGKEFDDRLEKGRILRQDPPSGSRVKVAAEIHVVVSSGSQAVTVPLFRGKSIEAAIPILKEIGLTKGPVTQIHSPHAAGLILAQNLPEGTRAERNAPVGFLVSQGGWEERYVMPDLIGKRASLVKARLQALEFNIGDIRYTYYPGLGKDIIIKQYPPEGYRVQKRNLITLEVSL
jgi:eukaryotic-like serine/threonine-protein kinase